MKKLIIMLSVLMCIVLTSCDLGSFPDNMEEEITPTASTTPTEAGKYEKKDEYTAERLYQVTFEAITQPIGKDMTDYYSVMEVDPIFSHSYRIPQELSEYIVEDMRLKEKVDKVPLSDAQEISQEEYSSLTGFSPEGNETVFPFILDADNDGIDDLIAQIYGGGTGGFSNMVL